ncbi:hypothetical protein OG21DRAFT_1485499 [Imleria badia]|nr:hypothetical protein OG21DRAFT_1485499 [Imleria badia]
MILRVWAMYNRSRIILGILLILLSLGIIPSIVNAAINSNPKKLSVSPVQIPGVSFCLVLSTPVWANEAAILQITHGAAMCILAIFQFVRQSLQMYRVTKQWQLNRYMSLLVKQGILYFFAYVLMLFPSPYPLLPSIIFLFNLLNMLSALGRFPAEGWQLILSLILNYVPIFALTPRFILSIRELYARDVEGRRGEGIDTGFGFSLSDRNTGETLIVFADVEQSGISEDIEEVGTTWEV